jgi:hypothetical protein
MVRLQEPSQKNSFVFWLANANIIFLYYTETLSVYGLLLDDYRTFFGNGDNLYSIGQEIKSIKHVEKRLGISNLLFMQISVKTSHSVGGNVNRMCRIQKVSISFAEL